ncbi:MAG: hypothetical protein O3B00_08665 [archaeon]|jgi:transcriptional regulator with XRE-family HTH domain|nr:hypothetical protein [archaeon]
MATVEQIARISYLRGNGLSQKDIAEDVGLSSQMISVILKKQAEIFNEKKPIRMIPTSGFEPKETVIEFPPTEFERFRESEILYEDGCDIFEIRKGLVHKTSFPIEIPPSIYPEIADVIEQYGLPDTFLDVTKMRKHFTNLFKAFRFKDHAAVMMQQYYEFPEEFDRNSREIRENLGEIVGLIANELERQTSELVAEFCIDVPLISEKAKLIRYQSEHSLMKFEDKLTLINTVTKMLHIWTDFELDYLISRTNDFPMLTFHILMKTSKSTDLEAIFDEAEIDIEQHFTKLLNFVLHSININAKQLDLVWKHNTFDPEILGKFAETGAPDVESLEEIERAGVENFEELKNAKKVFNSAPIDCAEFKHLSADDGRQANKIRKAMERGDIDDALTAAWTRFEVQARGLWGQRYFAEMEFRSNSRWNKGGELIEKIIASNIKNNAHFRHIITTENYAPSKEEINLLGDLWAPDRNGALGILIKGINRRPSHQTRSTNREDYCRELLFLTMSLPNRRDNVDSINSSNFANVLAPYLSDNDEHHFYLDQARIIRNDIIHNGVEPKNLLTRHVRVILEITELIIDKFLSLKKLLLAREKAIGDSIQSTVKRNDGSQEPLTFSSDEIKKARDSKTCVSCGKEWEDFDTCDWCGYSNE